MPRHREARKDAANGETRRGAVSMQRAADVRMGEPAIRGGMAPHDEQIVMRSETQGTETSKYLQERKVKTIP